MTDRDSIFAGANPFEISRAWLKDAEASEPNDPNAIALATTDEHGKPNVRMVLLKQIDEDSFVFYTNYESVKAQEIAATKHAAFVMHWKSLRRQIRVRGHVVKEDGVVADDYFNSRSLQSRIGAVASKQSQVLDSRNTLIAEAAKIGAKLLGRITRPDHWGGYRVVPFEVEFWADGKHRLHDRFRWSRNDGEEWVTSRLYP